MDKPIARTHFRELRNTLTTAQKNSWDRSICQQLLDLIEANEYRTIHTYLPIRTEVDLLPLIQQLLDRQLTVVCPKTLENRQLEQLILTDLNNLTTGLYSTKHPTKAVIYTGEYDLIIVPGLAFDRHGYRLGYGGGYYDTFLTNHPTALKVGAAYPFQLVDKLSHEVHDVPLNKIIIGR